MDELLQLEQQARAFMDQGKKDAAIRILFDLVLRYAKRRDFAKAEFLREKIFEVDPLALTEILKSAAAIEEAKSGAIDRNHLEVWHKLYSQLTKEEGNALFFALTEKELGADLPVFAQGEQNSNLYFVSSGQLKLISQQGDRELFIQRLLPGNVGGDDTFFSASICTTSLITLTRVKLMVLARSATQKWAADFPALESKIHDFCLRSERVSDLLKKKSLDRRTQRRIQATGTVFIKLINTAGQAEGKTLMGELTDIAVGGLSFLIKSRKKETARMLLGRKLNVKVSFAAGEVDRNGTVIGVRYNPQEFHQDIDYSVHLKFDKIIEKQLLREIELAGR